MIMNNEGHYINITENLENWQLKVTYNAYWDTIERNETSTKEDKFKHVSMKVTDDIFKIIQWPLWRDACRHLLDNY